MSEKAQIPEKDAIKESAVMEKRHWVRLTHTCNNGCLFCLDKDMQNGRVIPADEVRAEIKRGADMGGERLILSGGEATIHPDFIEFIKYGYSVGYRRVQTITNGRMFSYGKFADEAIDAGLSEATFSIHGHTPELHDYLVGVPGAFKQAVRGIHNLIGRCVVNIDIVINRQNVRHVSDIMEYFMQFGIHEFDLLHIVPFGDTYPKNKDILFYDIAENMKYLQKAFNHSKTPNRFIWTNRFPIYYLEGNEALIQDPHKLYDEVNGRRWMFNDFTENGVPISCAGERCKYCFIESFCGQLTEQKRRLNARDFERLRIDVARYEPVDGVAPADFKKLWIKADSAAKATAFLTDMGASPSEIVLELESYDSFDPADFPERTRVVLSTAADCEKFDFPAATLEFQIYLNKSTSIWIHNNKSAIESAKHPVIITLHNQELLSDAQAEDTDALAIFEKESFKNVTLLNLPRCIGPSLPHVDEEIPFDHYMLRENGNITIGKYAEYYIVNGYYSKSVRCRECAYYNNCRGLHVNYLRNFGFAQQQPAATAGK